MAGREILEPPGSCQRGSMVSSMVSKEAKPLDMGVLFRWCHCHPGGRLKRVPLRSLLHQLSDSDRPPRKEP